MTLHATIKIGSEIDSFLKLWDYKEVYMSKNLFTLIDMVYTCIDIKDIGVLNEEPDVEITAMGNIDSTLLEETN